jgi:isopenicillin N synthase-like dioxygenase
MIVYTPPDTDRVIPVIDLTGSFTGDAAKRESVAWAVHKACRDTGFFYVSNHGIPQHTLDCQLDWAQRFFALPLAAKRALSMEHGHGPVGYEPMQLQTLDLGSPPDLKEGFQFHRERFVGARNDMKDADYRGNNRWPSGIPGFREQMLDYHERVIALGRHLMGVIASSLELPEDYFSEGLNELMCSVRLLHYPPHPANAGFNQLGAGAHTDWGAITMLLQDGCGGLEVRHASGEWIRATPIPGTLIVNLGDMIRRWTNDLYHSTLHRVLNKESGIDRYSVASFFNPNYQFRVECLPTCVPEVGAPIYPPCTVGEHLKEMFEQTYGRGRTSAPSVAAGA